MRCRTKSQLLLLSAAAFFFSFSACRNPASSDDKDPKTGSLRITIQTGLTNIRTILPTFTGEIDEYVIAFEGPEAVEPVTLGGATTEHTETDIAVGDWTIKIEARKTDKTVLARGQGSATVTAGGTAAVGVSLTATQTGSGGVYVVFDWTGTGITTINEVVGSFTPTGGEAEAIVFTVSGTTASWSVENRASGSYELSAAFNYHSGETVVEYGAWESALHIYDNLVTKGSDAGDVILLTSNDFDALPTAPTDLACAETVGGVLLEWVDNSIIETGFVVERSTAEEGAYEAYAESAANVVTLSPASADQLENATWYYRVRAKNQIGLSDPSGVVAAKWEKPTVVSIVPADGSTDVDRSANFIVVFSESMDTSVLGTFVLNYPTAGALNLSTSTSAMAFSETSEANDTLTIDPTAFLSDRTPDYWGNLAIAGFQDAAGNSLETHSDPDYSFYNKDFTPPGGAITENIAVGSVKSTSVALSWPEMGDNSFPQEDIVYDLYYAETDGGVSTPAWRAGTHVGAFQNTATEYSGGTYSYTITGLDPATTYYFNVIAADPNGNENLYITASATTVDVGSIGFTITVSDPSDETFTFTDGNGDPVASFQILKGDLLTVNLGQTFESYSWRVDGAVVATSRNLTDYDTSDLDYGVHRLTLYVLKGGKYYSKSISFTVIN